MKLNRSTIAFALGLTAVRMVPEYGCMERSFHTKFLDDPKTYHIVVGPDGGPCPCPCTRHCAQYRCLLNRGQCPVCKHYRIPRPYVIVDPRSDVPKNGALVKCATSRAHARQRGGGAGGGGMWVVAQ